MTHWKDKYIELLEKHNEALSELTKVKERDLLIVVYVDKMTYSSIEGFKNYILNCLQMQPEECRILVFSTTNECARIEVFNLNNIQQKLESETIRKLERVLK
jgi:hypothetical protein